MTTDAGSGFDDKAAGRDAGANLDDVEEESRHVGDEPDTLEEERERKRVHDEVNDAFQPP